MLCCAGQVLGDDAQRANYDRLGADAMKGKFVDAGVFFTMLFGAERFEPYIGTLALASAASMEGQLSMHRMQVLTRTPMPMPYTPREAQSQCMHLTHGLHLADALCSRLTVLQVRQRKREVECALRLVEMVST